MINFKLDKDFSAYPEYSGRELKWLPSDSAELYKRNCKSVRTKTKLKKEGWLDRKFTYKFNSHGFRSDEFTSGARDSIVFLGCSHTIGIGIPYENTFGHVVAKEFGLRNYNLGVGAGSNDSAFRFGSHWIPKLKPRVVILVSPYETRSELFSQFGVEYIETSSGGKFLRDYRNLFFGYPLNSKLNREKNILALRQICSLASVPFLLYDSTDLIYKDSARDLIHSGIKSNKQFAEQIIPEVKTILESK